MGVRSQLCVSWCVAPSMEAFPVGCKFQSVCIHVCACT